MKHRISGVFLYSLVSLFPDDCQQFKSVLIHTVYVKRRKKNIEMSLLSVQGSLCQTAEVGR